MEEGFEGKRVANNAPPKILSPIRRSAEIDAKAEMLCYE